MKLRGLLTAIAAMLLLAGMFVAVHRGASGRELGERIAETEDRQAVAEVKLSELRRKVEELRGRTRIVRAARRLGLHMPSEDEFVILDLRGWDGSPQGGSR